MKREQAMSLFKQGYNCSQSVLLAFSGELGLDVKTAAAISSSFGGGMGRLREVCGAVSGMFMAAGLKYGSYPVSDKDAKALQYKRVQELACAFSDKNGSIVCRELLGLNVKSESYIPEERTDSYYKKRPCAELVGDAAEILEKYFSENQSD